MVSSRTAFAFGSLAAVALLAAGGCSGAQSALDPASPYARGIATHWWVMLVLGGAVFLIVVAFFIRAITSPPTARSADNLPAHSGDDEATTRRKARVIGAGVVATLAILLVVMVHAVALSRQSNTGETGAVEIEVTGYQWWWDVRYLHQRSDQQFRTANEVHIPVGEPVLLRLRSADVIHSFWIPNLHGKVDMIPGRENLLRIQADRPGSWRGQCAEFCGLQHAHMAFVVVAHPRAEFDSWRAGQLRPSVPPADPLARAGERVFGAAQCAFCHTVRGTSARGRVGPDLTHLASRRTLAAGTLPNTRGNLGGWILDPHSVKPGVLMPPTPVDARNLHALLQYLMGLR